MGAHLRSWLSLRWRNIEQEGSVMIDNNLLGREDKKKTFPVYACACACVIFYGCISDCKNGYHA